MALITWLRYELPFKLRLQGCVFALHTWGKWHVGQMSRTLDGRQLVRTCNVCCNGFQQRVDGKRVR